MPTPASAPPSKQQELKVEWFNSVQGMETREQRDAITPGFWSWLMNIQPIGARTLRILNGKGTTRYTAPSGDTIVWYGTTVIGSSFYLIVFLKSGKADQVSIATGTVTHISTTANTFWAGSGAYPHFAAWGNSGIVIVSPVGYWAWDGTTLYSAGATAPTWLQAPGTSTTTMPTGISGNAIEIYNASAWVLDGLTILATAPGGGNDFATSHGGVSDTVQDAYVQTGYVGLKALDGFLYLFAPSAVDVISDVQTSGSTPTTTFLRVPVSTSIGTPWRDTIVSSPASLVCSNSTGVFEVQGGNIRKVSSPMDGIFENATFPAASTDPTGYHPAASMITLSEVPCYAVTATVTDPDTSASIKALIMWDGKRWFMATQETQPIIVAREDSSSNFIGWGSDGTTIFQLFKTASSTLSKKAKSWMSSADSGPSMRKMLKRVYAQFANAPGGAPLSSFDIDTESGSFTSNAIGTPGLLTFVNNLGGTLQFQNNSLQNLYFSLTYPLVIGGAAYVVGCVLFGVTVSTSVGTLDIVALGIGWIDYSRWQ